MLTKIANKSQNEYASAFNDKVELYNKTQQQNQSKTELLQLLNEINHMHMTVKKLYMDSNYQQKREYQGIMNFPGIGNELEALKLPNVQGLAAENIFTKELKSNLRLPTEQQWEKLSNEHTKSVLSDLKRVDELLSRMPFPPSEQQANEYFYALKGFKNIILNKLSYEVTNNTDRKYFTSLLHSLNNEIEIIKPFIPSEIKRDEKIEKVSKTTLMIELSELSSENMDKLAMILRNHNAVNPGPPTKEDIAKILPSITNFDIKKLGGNNNINWKISDQETGLDLVIQVGEPSTNQKLIESLELSSANEYLATQFFTSLNTDDLPFNIVVTELCSGGDLRHEREEKLKDATPEDILKNATSRMQDLTSFCQSSLKNNSIHPDIKLTNFLINSDGNFILTDKKTFTKIDEAGNVPRKDIVTTGVYEPPEMKSLPQEVKAEAFMCYQIGLALYDYLVLPKEPTEEHQKYWSEEIPLEFTNQIFETDKGIPLKALLTQMLDPDPLKRPPLSEVHTKLQQIYPRNINQVDQEMSSENKISASYRHRTRDSGREHKIEVSGKNFQELKEGFKNLRGDGLKTAILDDIKSKIEKTSSLEDLKKLKDDFKKSDEFKVLNTAQGATTKFLQGLSLKNTTSINTLNDMFKEQENSLCCVSSGFKKN